MRITVVTPVLNGAAFVGETVASVLDQHGAFELEYIVRDGGSTDGTLAVLEQFGDRVKVVSKPDGSPQAAINAGMASATGEVGAWLNADDAFEPGALQAVAEAFTAHPGARWLYGRCAIMDASGRPIRRPITCYKHMLGHVYSWNLLLCENYISQPATFWRTDLWHEAGGLTERYLATFDYDLWLRMAAISRPLSLHRRLARFRRHPMSISERHFVQQFREECEASAGYGSAAHSLLHRVLAGKTVLVYRILALLSKHRASGNRRCPRPAHDA